MLEVLAGVDGDHSGMGLRRLGRDALDPRVRERRAQDRDVRHAGQPEVVDVLPRPVTRRGSSTRLTGLPIRFVAIACSLRVEGGRRFANREDDVLVAGAAAEVALEAGPDLLVG